MKLSPAVLITIIVLLALGVWWYQAGTFERLATPEAPRGLIISNPTNFVQAGVITFNNPGQEPNTPYLVYDAPGQPAVTTRLLLDPLSVCAAPNGATPCLAMSVTLDVPFGGKRVVVEGEETGNVVLVRKLRVIEEADIVPVADAGRRFISWEQARELIRSCEVSMIAQTHSLDVNLTLKSGDKVVAVEPVIDEVFKVAQEADCGNVPIATE